MSGATLSDRIASTLQGEPSSAECERLIASVKQEMQRLEGQREKARQASLSPLARTDVVTQAREEAKDCSFRIERLTVAIEQLQAKAKLATAPEEESAYRARHAELSAERDALAQELGERYPALSSELASLFGRIAAATNQRVNAFNQGAKGPDWIKPVEAQARGMPANSIWTLADAVRLPPFDCREHAMGRSIWPLPSQFGSVVPPALAKSMAAAGDEGRRIAQVNLARLREAEERKRRFRASRQAEPPR